MVPIRINMEKARGDRLINTNNECIITINSTSIPNNIKDNFHLIKEALMVSDVISGSEDSIRVSGKGKCARCWKYNVEQGELCDRCENYMKKS